MHYDQIIDCGDGNAIKLNTNSPDRVTIVTDAYFLGAGVEINFEKARELISHLQDWIDDNPEGEICELNEGIAAGDLLNGHQSRSNDHGS